MGMFDELVFDADLPDFPLECRRFQTKAFERCLDRYRVTKSGRLLLAGSTILDEGEVLPIPNEEEAFDIECHGEIRLVPVEGDFAEYVARFTNGTFESIRALDRSESAPSGVRFKYPER